MDRIDFIENHLSPAIQIEGQELKAMNILDRMAYYHVPGVSVAVVENGEIAFTKSFGVSDAETRQPVTPATLFQAASISKPVSALAAMRLVQAGKLNLDADVNSVLKSWHVPENEFTNQEKVTLRRLLSHNAGLTVHGFPGYAQGVDVPTIQQVLLGQPPANTGPVLVDVLPGSIWRYSGGGTTIVQLMMMEATGLDYAELMQKYALGPAGMSRSTYQQPLPVERQAEATTAHYQTGKPIPGKWHTYPEQAAAGLWTTPEDLCRYVIALQKAWHGKADQVLSQEFARQMLSVQFQNWGIGPKISGEGQSVCFSHGGSNEGFRCEMMGFLHTGQGLAVMTNSDSGDSLSMEIVRAAALAYGWQDFLPQQKAVISLPVGKVNEYVGTYALKDSLEVKIDLSSRDGRLLLNSPMMLAGEISLHPYADDRFFDTETGFLFEFKKQGDDQIMILHISDFEILAVRENQTI